MVKWDRHKFIRDGSERDTGEVILIVIVTVMVSQ